MDEVAPFRTFRTPEEAEALASDLEVLGFTPTIEDSRNYISSAFVGASPEYFSVKLPSSDFLRAEAALEEVAERQIAEVGDDHYLFSFTDEELTDVVLKPDEWNAFDRRLARRIVAERGMPVEAAADELIREARIEELATPAKPQPVLVLIGYASCLLGGIIGIWIGHHLNTTKKTLPNGDRVYMYREEDRAHGKQIFFIGVFVFVGCIVVRLVGLIG